MALDPTKIRVAAGRIYAGTTPPAAGAALALTAGVPATGTELGLTQGESVLTYEVTYDEEMSDQVLGPVAVFATQEMMHLEFTMLEYAAAQLQDFFQQAGLTIDNGSSPKTDLFEMGQLGTTGNAVTKQSMTLVSPIPGTSPQRYTIVMLFSAYQAQAASLRYTREGSSIMKTMFHAIADTTRTAGSFMGQVVVERN